MSKKKKIIIISVVAAVIAISSVVAAILIFRKKNEFNARDVYAMAAASSVEYLSNDGGASQTSHKPGLPSASFTSASAKPETLTDNDTKGIYNCLTLFDGIISSGGVSQKIKDNTSSNTLLSNYTFEMEISLPTGSGTSIFCTMYFNEIETATQTKIDDGKKEIETSTTFEGVIVYGTETFIVNGKTEVETEGKETEYSIEFKTYKNTSPTGLVADTENYVIVEQSFEEDEVEYEYIIYKDGVKVQDCELEFEQEKHGIEIEFQLKDLTNDTLNETIFKIKKGNSSSTFVVYFYKNGASDLINIEKLANNSYKFTYSNTFTETIPTPQP